MTASASGLAGSTANIEVQLRSFTLVSPLVGINRAVTATITLDQAAPAGGATFNLSVANTSVATVSPASITIPEGSVTGAFQLTGGTGTGYTSVIADGTANGFVSKTLNITVTDRLIDMPLAVDASLGSTHTVPVLIGPDQAAAGGVVITVISSNPAVVQVLTPTVTIPEGTFQATVQVRAATGATGSATITASNPDYAPDVMQVTVTSGLNILETFSNFGQAETDSLHIQLQSADLPYTAPTGGVVVTLAAADTTCVTAPASMTIAAGAIFNIATLSYGGSATLPCTTTVTASNGLFGTDTVTVTVGQAPDLGAATITDPWANYFKVGSSLQKPLRINLATANHGGVKVQIKSDNPGISLVAPDATTPGAPVTELNVPNGTSYVDFYVQGVRNTTGTVSLRASTARFTTGTASVQVVVPTLQIVSLAAAYTSLDPDVNFYVRAGVLNGASISQWQGASAGEGPLPVTVTSSAAGVGAIKKTGDSGASETIYLAVGAT